jgi:DNA-binding NarL/FixJ family response regulator
VSREAPHPLHIIAIVQDEAAATLIGRTLGDQGDGLSVVRDLADGLARAASEVPDVVLVEVALGGNAGLAVVHHVRALSPQAHVYALARPQDLELATQAIALGGTGLLLMPLSGDELIGAISRVRAQTAERRLREELERELSEARITARLQEGLDAIVDTPSRRGAARRVADAFVMTTGARRAAVFLRASEASRELMLVEQVGEFPDLPSFCDEMTLLEHAGHEPDVDVVRLANRVSQQGLLLLGGSTLLGAGKQAAFERAGAQAALLIALGAEREAASRGTMKDPDSSAYTFAYFVDVAGREIDKARRHGRRFALATLTVGDGSDGGDAPWSVQLAERVLSAVRDTDVLARVDEHEFYLLLPETSGIGAHACRRRVMRSFRESAQGAALAIGVATYPHDGSDLSQLMRVARSRADASRESAVFSLELESLGLGEMLDALLWTGDPAPRIEAPRLLELPRADVVALAAAAVSEARRSGSTWAVATDRPGISIAGAVRTALGAQSETARVEAVDIESAPGYADLEAFTLVTEHGAYSLIGRLDGNVVRGVHSADPLLADLIVDRLGDTVGTRFGTT